MRVLQFNAAYAADLADPEALLDRYEILTGWSEALLEAGAAHVAVLQRFQRDARVVRRGVEYVFYADGYGPEPPTRAWLRDSYRRAACCHPDIVHVNGLDMAFQIWALRRWLPRQVAIVAQDHASAVPGRPSTLLTGWRRLVRRQALAAADGVLFTTRPLATPWHEAGLLRSAQPVFEVPAASTRFTPVEVMDARRAMGMGGDPVILWVGRLAPIKDPVTVLRGFRAALRMLPSATLTIAHNDGTAAGEVRALIGADPALGRRVRMITGVARSQMPVLFSAADLFVVGSHHEACGLAALEALACGVWPVVPAIPSFEWLTAHGTAGTLWTVGDHESLANAIQQASGPTKRLPRERIIDYFNRTLSWPRVGRAAMSAYDHVIARRRHRHPAASRARA